MLNEKAKAVYYHGGQSALKMLPVLTAAVGSGTYAIIVNAAQEGDKWYYDTAATVEGLEAVTAGYAITVANWTELTANPLDNSGAGITAGTDKFVRVVCVKAVTSGGSTSYLPISVGDALINVGE